MKEPEKTAADYFHAHLDVCAQCEKHPFDLCTTGARLLQTAATEPNTDALLSLIDDMKRQHDRNR